MKKVMTKVFMAAAILAGVNVLSSCKDYDEDKYFEIVNGEGGAANLKEYIDSQDAALKALIDQLKALQESCKNSCETNFTKLNTLIAQLQEKDTQLNDLINEKADKTVVDALQGEVNTIKGQISTVISDIATLQTNVTTIQNDITLINQTLDDLKPRVEKNEQDIASLQGDVATINSTIITIKSDIQTLQGDVDGLKTAVNTINQTLVAYDTRITTAQQTASDALALANSNKTYIQNVETALNNYKTEVNGKLTVIDGRLDNLEAAVADLQNQINELAEEALRNFQTAIAIAKQLDAELKAEMLQAIADAIADYDANLQAQLTQIVNDLNTRINEVEQGYKDADEDLQAQIDAIDAAYKAADTALKSELIQKIADAKQEVLDILNPKIEDLQSQIDALVAKDTELQSQIDNLQSQVDQNTADILSNTNKINDLTGRVTNLENAIKKMVTGITVQGTYNPVYGTFALPVGVQSNVLMAFVGKTTEDVTFPTTQTGNYVYTDQALTEAEATVIGSAMESYFKKGGKDLLSSTDDNAGTLYVTVNPNTVDFDGLKFTLENSQAKSAGVELLPLEKTDDVLTFGYTRAADNGFYAAKAHIDPSKLDQVQKIDINKSRFKETAANLLKNRTFNFGSFVNAVYDEMNGFLDANAVVARWSDDLSDKEHCVASQYNLAATAIHPLSYSFGKDFAGKSTLPGFERLENFIDRAANAINSRINSAFNKIYTSGLYQDIPGVTINNITIKDLEDTDFDLSQFNLEFNLNKTFDLGEQTFTFDIDQNVSLPLIFTATADLSGQTVTMPSIHVTADGTVAEVLIPVFEDKNNNGIMDEGEQVMGDDGKPIYSVFPATNVDVEGDTDAGTVVTFPDGTTATVSLNQTVDTHITLHDLSFTIEEGTFTFTVNETFSKDLTGAIKDLWAVVQSEVGNVNDMLDQFRNLLDDVNFLLDDINNFQSTLTSTVNNTADKLKEYLQKFNDKGISIINGIVARMQPCLLVSTPSGAKMGINSKSHPTLVNSTDVTLFPTSYTAEIVTPAFKKHIACVEALDKKGNQEMSEAARVNGLDKMNTVLDGAELNSVNLQLKSGYTYHFTYSALDYSGKICVKRAWVRVK